MDKNKSELEPKTESSYKFVGWIPCISGHLDFGLLNVGLQGGFTNSKRKDPNSFCPNFAKVGFKDSHARRSVIQSWVDWKDRIDSDGDYRVCVISEANSSEDLNKREMYGTAVVYRKKYETAQGEYNCTLLDALHDLNATYEQKARNCTPSEWSSIQKELNQLWEIAVGLVPTSSTPSPSQQLFGESEEVMPDVYRVDFRIKADGLTYLSFVNLHGQSIEKNSEIIRLTDEDRFIICRQIFYYLKYSLHVHKHHEHQADALTSIVPNNPQAGLKLVGQVKRELSAIKRIQLFHKRLHHTSEAIGIIGYLNSLLVALKDKGFLDDEDYEKELVRSCSLEKSFSGQSARIEDSFKKRSHISSTAKQTTMMMMSYVSLCLIAFINLFKSHTSTAVESPLLNQLGQGQLNFVLLPITMLISIAGFYFTLTFYYKLREENLSFWKKVYTFNDFWLYLIIVFPPLIVLMVAAALNF
ncbi:MULTISPECIES: hypothetical protein [Pseudoalteromonas]|uniref:hypothetical protein n=1 Tax=Pseudoalteromonas TaxID=53246 RepID=UPI00272D8DF8|nr:hypothetical protein [Pseudoalteromonas sp.]